MKNHHRVMAWVMALFFELFSMSAHADWVGDFYNSAGAASNVTTPQAIATQSSVGYSGGGLTWRVPQKNFQPMQITPPSLKSGCGGIDAYLGGFSFPNKAEFVQALRNFGQAAVGYFFQLALRTMAPEIAVTLDVINDIAQRVNQFSMNSCANAQKAVDFLAGDLMKKNTSDASGYARAAGQFVDDFDSMFGLQGKGGEIMKHKYMQTYGKPKESLVEADLCRKLPVHVNVLFYAIKCANSVTMTNEEINLIMALVGPSVIVTEAASDDGEKSAQTWGLAKTIDFKDLVGTNVLGSVSMGNATSIKCDEYVQCLNPGLESEAFKSFSVRTYEAIIRIRENIRDRQAATNLTDDHKLVLKLSSVPIYRAAALAESSGVAAILGDQIVMDLADYAAVDAAVRMVTHHLTSADKALAVVAGKLPQNLQPQLQGMRDRVNTIKDSMYVEVTNFYQQKGNPYQKIEQLDKVERAMYTNLNSMLASNARFGKRQ